MLTRRDHLRMFAALAAAAFIVAMLALGETAYRMPLILFAAACAIFGLLV
ncbi:hypothetical protein NK718_20080 [Alsobacter sp. SYSU M60028]|uniref:Uncharacterized protein n=1 Tax=Alsobacter ponti TaxID=2962936 RepID=A0ABT1LH48_9HYPH|nr:hypothetical protein [Alsobacter ponti]MCP8940831.1 hypothetical protein [Alsobacter ponti]